MSRAAAGNRDEPSGRERKSEAPDAVLPSKQGDRARLRPGQPGSLRPWVGRASDFLRDMFDIVREIYEISRGAVVGVRERSSISDSRTVFIAQALSLTDG